jgi:hypothetical protein
VHYESLNIKVLRLVETSGYVTFCPREMTMLNLKVVETSNITYFK